MYISSRNNYNYNQTQEVGKVTMPVHVDQCERLC